MAVIAFRHVPYEHLGRIAPALTEAGLDWVYADGFSGAALPPWESAAGLIFMGGPMSANDDVPYLRAELEVLERALAAGKPTLGICLGAQLLAKAAGARVYRNPVAEIGWYPVFWKDAARRDALLAGLDKPETVFHWHGETFELPRGAEWLASSEACAHQAFRLGNAWGLQFHLEVTPKMIAGWCVEDANASDVRGLASPLDPEAHASRLEYLAATIFGRWARLAAAGSKIPDEKMS